MTIIFFFFFFAKTLSSDAETSRWLNQVIEKFWPFLGNYIKKLLIENVSILLSYVLLDNFQANLRR